MSEKRYPFSGFPTGWYAVARGDELPPETVRGVRYFGEDIALFRTADGTVHATGAYCPHLGAYLPEGGKVDGDRLRCPFHGFEFDGAGACVKNAYGTKPPPKARLRVWRTREVAGMVLVWFDALGRTPDWEVEPPDMSRFGPLRMKTLRLRSHPQETSENSVDLGHFSEVHGFRHAQMIAPCETDGPLLTSGYSVEKAFDVPGFDRVLGWFGKAGRGVYARFHVRVEGLGWSLVDGEVPALGLRFRHFVLSSPVDDEYVDLRIGTTIERWKPGLDRLALELIYGALVSEVSRDLPIWEKKRYVARPVLAKGDGPIPAYRRWCQQFYPPTDTQNVHLPLV